MCSYRPTNYNIPDAIKGDTFDGVLFTVTVNNTLADLTDAIIKMDLRLTPTGTVVKNFTTVNSGGLTILNPPTDGKFKLDKQVITINPDSYLYDIQITFGNGEIKTYVGGNWEIIQDITT
jgi:hypothetical protein